MELRKLDPARHAALVAGLFFKANDYVRLTEGVDAGPAQVAGFFKGVPPGCDIARSVKVGLFEGESLLGIADMAFGYPEAGDGYIGLMLFAPQARGQGFGKALLALLEEEARARNTERLFVGVVQANAPARVFWLREGFMPLKTLGPVKVGATTHLVDRMGKSLAR
jgi:GNAT superfamily N-acetyltransferase